MSARQLKRWIDLGEPESVPCPLCGGEGAHLGGGGNLIWFRCIGCGVLFSRKVDNPRKSAQVAPRRRL